MGFDGFKGVKCEINSNLRIDQLFWHPDMISDIWFWRHFLTSWDFSENLAELIILFFGMHYLVTEMKKLLGSFFWDHAIWAFKETGSGILEFFFKIKCLITNLVLRNLSEIKADKNFCMTRMYSLSLIFKTSSYLT